MEPRPFDRASMLDALRAAGDGRGEPFDVLVVGGGITGVGVALDAAARGLRTALVERDDFASGTSSRSSKMIHGGLRYLQNGDVRLVYQALRERKRLMRNASHLVHVLPFLIPIMTRDGVVSRRIARALGWALWMYDLTGGWRIGRLHRRVTAEEAAAHFPTTHVDRLSGGYLYYDAIADDARLTLTVARTAAQHGSVLVNRCRVVELIKAEAGAGGRAAGAVVEADGERFAVPARVVVSAAGVWSDELRTMDEGVDPRSIRPAKGVHLTVPWEKVRNDVAVIIPVRGDRRSLFLVPWGERLDGTFHHTYVGTTDTDHGGPLDDPQCEGADFDYVLDAVNAAVTTGITRADVTGVWSGLRPLLRSADPGDKTADLSRLHVVEVSASGVVRVGGGKLTTYREMAEDAVDVVERELGRRRWRPSRPTRRLELFGAEARGSVTPGGLDAHLAGRYGSATAEVRALMALDPELAEPLVGGQPYVRAEAVYAARHEMATTLDDVLVRRTRAHLFDRAASRRAAPAVAELLGGELGWSPATVQEQIDRYDRLCAAEEEAGEHVTHAAD